MKNFFPDDKRPFTPCFRELILVQNTPSWSEPQETVRPEKREGKTGSLTQILRTSPGMELMHEMFVSDNGKLMLCRAKLKNTGKKVLSVERIPVYAVMCDLCGTVCHCGMRLNSGKPYSFVNRGDDFSADPDLLIRRPTYILLFSWVETHFHPAMVRIRKNPHCAGFCQDQILSAEADFHGQEIPPGREILTQTLAVRLGHDYNKLLSEHAASICNFYHAGSPRKPAPFVLSSWHYWGLHVSEETIEAELNAAKARKIPGEVYQVDAGYHTLFGDWLDANERFPHGLPALAARIARYGLTPGLWLAPFMVNPESKVARTHPDWILRKQDGTPVCFKVSQLCHVLDLSMAPVRSWLEELFRTLYEAGFRYFKIDFTHCYFRDEEMSVVRDRQSNLTLSYRMAIEAIRRGIGEESFLNVCGGHYGCLVGLADSQRTGADTYARWMPAEDPAPAWYRIQQGMFRSWLGAWRYNDPDAAAIRLCSKPLDSTIHGQLSLGDLTDDEARLMVLHLFLAGGVPALGENLQELQEDRLQMMRRVVPSCRIPAQLLNPFDMICPSRFVTRLPERNGLPPQSIVSVINVDDEERLHPFFMLDERILPAEAGQYMVWDMTSDRLIGIFRKDEEFSLGCVLPHSIAVASVTPLGSDAVPVGSDGHYGFGEIAEFSAEGAEFSGRIASMWIYPLTLSIAIPEKQNWIIRSVKLPAQSRFDTELFYAGTEEFAAEKRNVLS